MPARSAPPKLAAALLAVLLAACAQAPAPGPTLPPAATRQPTTIPQPTFTPTPTSTPTLTPMPILPPDETQALVLALLKDETDCHLPCWFGVIPGETTWPEAYNFFKTFSSQIIKWHDDPEQPFIESEVNNFTVAVPETLTYRSGLGQGFKVENNIITYVWGDPAFSLTHLLATYGKPTEVWVRVNPFMAPPFQVFMAIFYPENKTIVRFSRHDAQYSRPGVVSACFDSYQEISYQLTIDIWSTVQSKTWRDFKPFSNRETVPPPLEDAIGMDLDTFYETYKNPAVEPCFEFPDDIW